MHRAEFLFISVWVPLTVMVALGDVLFRHLPAFAAVLLLVPAGFLTLNLLALVLGASTPSRQWRMWLAACALWAWFHRDAAAPVSWIAGSWLAILSLNILASIPILLAKLMPGRGNVTVTQRLVLLVMLHALALLAGWLWGWWWAVAAGAAIAAGFCWCVLNPSSQWLGPVRRRNDTDEILITIDDGPDPHDTPRLLDLLDRYHVKAVFFMIGEKVEKHPELAREVLRRGHEIGNHTMTHPQRTFWCAGPWRTRREIEQSQRVIKRVTGVEPRRFRAPVGHRNPFTHPVAHELGLEVTGWSRRGFDAVETDVPRILRRILKNLAPGDIVLVHEGTPVAGEVLEAVLAAARDA
ncbi:MAG TPA: polysaccharide deacetylase family protein, partial [Luteolibacter sp.]|nr:polysaccharide deacetylase family protein [Luteolibacter sp.]